ncbi:MAG: PEP-CTERM sorting domain-containing protein [Burkholderiales bacterium]|nr:PEP-CTERM sorting domain-containing protein [Burkholderiales bacterium]
MNRKFAARLLHASCALLIGLSAPQASAALIAPTGATASSTDFAGRDPIYAINGSGLTADSNVATGFRHNTSASNYMWNTVGRGQDNNPFILFDLGARYDVSRLFLWNFNEEIGNPANNPCCTGFGMRDVIISAGTTANALTTVGQYQFQEATGLSSYGGEIINLQITDVQFVLFTPLNTWSGTVFGPNYSTPPGLDEGRGITGLSEVRFDVGPASTVPEPGTLALFGLAIAGLSLRKRRMR